MKAVLFANNTLLAAGEAFGPFAAHEAPCFHVHTSSVRLTLEGKERFAEGPPDDKKSGFRIAIFSPEVQAYNEVARRQHKGQVKVRPLVTPSFGNQMILAKKNVICNNLGGYGPEKEKLAQLHYRGVAKLHGRPVDVVLEARPGYRPKKANLNGLSHNAASVNLAMGSAAELELRFLRASHQVQESEAQPVIFSKLFLRIFDSEEPIPTIRAGEVILHGAKAAYWPNGTAQLLPKDPVRRFGHADVDPEGSHGGRRGGVGRATATAPGVDRALKRLKEAVEACGGKEVPEHYYPGSCPDPREYRSDSEESMPSACKEHQRKTSRSMPSKTSPEDQSDSEDSEAMAVREELLIAKRKAAWKALCLPPLPLWGCVEEAVHLGQLYRINADANMPEPDKKHEALSGLGTQGGAAYPIPFCDLAAESLGPQLSI
ncbi:unnamed protein product [Durusdinium trenchii]|uniref:Uncharacterized protein n=1 Tax=Durusdinium trenchii TaxID=1381693 RepID=A0ABP0PCC5_9DINO